MADKLDAKELAEILAGVAFFGDPNYRPEHRDKPFSTTWDGFVLDVTKELKRRKICS